MIALRGLGPRVRGWYRGGTPVGDLSMVRHFIGSDGRAACDSRITGPDSQKAVRAIDVSGRKCQKCLRWSRGRA